MCISKGILSTGLIFYNVCILINLKKSLLFAAKEAPVSAPVPSNHGSTAGFLFSKNFFLVSVLPKSMYLC